MTITANITLNDKRERAFNKQLDGRTPEALAEIIVQEQAQEWADADEAAGLAAMTAVGKEILAATPDKQEEAIAAALAVVRS